MELIGVFFGLIGVIANYGTKWVPNHDAIFYNETGDGGNSTAVLPFSPAGVSGGSVAMCVFGLIVVPLLLFGVLKERHVFLIPHLVYQAIMLIINVIFLIFFCLGAVAVAVAVAATSKSSGAEYVGVTVGLFVFLIFVAGISILLDVYFFFVVFKCYRYLKEKTGSFGGFA